MLSRQADNIANAVRLLVAMGGFASAPGHKSGLGVCDAIRKVAARPPKSLATMADDLTASARTTFAGFRDAPPDADILFVQMVEAGLLTPDEITAAGMDPAACTAAMHAKLTDRSHTSGAMPGLFVAITEPMLARLLAGREYAVDLTPAFMAEVLQSAHRIEGKIDDVVGRLDHIEVQSRDMLEPLALRFGEAAPEALSLVELRAFLIEKARDYRALREEVEALRGSAPRIDKVLSAVEAAIESLDLAEADRLLASLRETTTEALRKPLEENARVIEAQARLALLRGDAESAYSLFSNAADSFAIISSAEAVRRGVNYAVEIYSNAARYSGQGLRRSEEMLRKALQSLPQDYDGILRCAATAHLGLVLSERGIREVGAAGVDLLDEAIRTLAAARDESARGGHLLVLGRSLNNLGRALRIASSLNQGFDKLLRLEQAVIALRQAVEIFSAHGESALRAESQTNLGVATIELGRQTPLGAPLLEEALDAFQGSANYFSEAELPLQSAQAEDNLGIAKRYLTARVEIGRGRALLGEAIEHHAAASSAFLQLDHPISWMKSRMNSGDAHIALAEAVVGKEALAQLHLARKAYFSAFRASEQFNYSRGKLHAAMRLGKVHETIARNEHCCAPRDELKKALDYVHSALRLCSDDQEFQRSEAREALSRIETKLSECT